MALCRKRRWDLDDQAAPVKAAKLEDNKADQHQISNGNSTTSAPSKDANIAACK
jgi:hypothetical protein